MVWWTVSPCRHVACTLLLLSIRSYRNGVTANCPPTASRKAKSKDDSDQLTDLFATLFGRHVSVS